MLMDVDEDAVKDVDKRLNRPVFCYSLEKITTMTITIKTFHNTTGLLP